MNNQYTLCIIMAEGVFFMCRKNYLWGFALLAFGLGLLAGCWLETELSRICFGIALMGGGYLIIQKK